MKRQGISGFSRTRIKAKTLHLLFQFPDPTIISNYYEPMVNGTIIAPDIYISEIMALCQVSRTNYKYAIVCFYNKTSLKNKYFWEASGWAGY